MAYDAAQIEALKQKAAQNIGLIASGQTLGTGPQAQLLSRVKVTTGLGMQFNNSNPDQSMEELVFMVSSDELKNRPDLANELGKKLLAEFNNVNAIHDNAAVQAPGEYVTSIKTRLEKVLKPAYPGLAQQLLESPIFDPNVGPNTVSDKYAIHFNNTGTGLTAFIPVPTRGDTDRQAEHEAKDIEEAIRAREAEIKSILKKRLKKYVPSATAEDEAKIDALNFKVGTSLQDKHATVLITFASKDQLDAQKDPTLAAAKNPEELKKTNPLSLIPSEDIGKALGRAILFTGERAETPVPYFAKVAGREDMKNFIGKLVTLQLRAHPENKDLAVEAERLAKEEIWKSTQQWNLPAEKRETPRLMPRVMVSPEPGKEHTLGLCFHLPMGKAEEVLQQLAGLTRSHNAPSVPVPANDVVTEALAAIPGQPEHTAKLVPSAQVSDLQVSANKGANQSKAV